MSILHSAIVLIFVPCLVGLVAIKCDIIHNRSLVEIVENNNGRANSKSASTNHAARLEMTALPSGPGSGHQALIASYASELARRKNENLTNGIVARAATSGVAMSKCK